MAKRTVGTPGGSEGRRAGLIIQGLVVLTCGLLVAKAEGPVAGLTLILTVVAGVTILTLAWRAIRRK